MNQNSILNVEKVIKEEIELLHNSILIIGQNASAKTYIIEKMIERYKDLNEKTYFQNIYYINVNNKEIDFEKIENFIKIDKSTGIEKIIEVDKFKEIDKLINSKKNIDERLLISGATQDNFASSLFTEKGSIFFASYFMNSKKVKKLIENYFDGKNIKIIGENQKCFEIGEEKHSRLSEGYKVIFRILSEIHLANNLGIKTIFIDEICKNLDNENAFKLIKFIKENFKDIKFIITTHSSDVILGAENFNVIQIQNSNAKPEDKKVKIFDSNDFDSDVTTKRTFFPTIQIQDFSEDFNKVNKIANDLIFEEKTLGPDENDFLMGLKGKQEIPSYIKEKVNYILYELVDDNE